MRRSLILTVAAATSLVLLAMLVPLAVLLRGYALEDRVARAGLDVQATETVVSGQDKGAVATYLERVNTDDDVQTTVLYPPSDLHPDGEGIGPTPGETEAVVRARLTGQASIRDDAGGVEILVPVSLGGSSGSPRDTPVVRVEVRPPGLESDLVRSWLLLLALGVVLLVGALVVADRLGRSFVLPVRRLADYAMALGRRQHPSPVTPSGPREVRELTASMNTLVGRIEALLARERAGVADLSHRLRTPVTALRLRIDGLANAEERTRLSADLDDLQARVDHVVREARRSEREGIAPAADGVSVLSDRARYWSPLAEDQGRRFLVRSEISGPVPVRAAEEDLQALVDVLLDNVFTHTPDDSAVEVILSPGATGGLRLVVDDAGPGFPPDLAVSDRGASGSGSTGLGLSIADKTATESGGGLSLGPSPSGGGRVVVDLGPA